MNDDLLQMLTPFDQTTFCHSLQMIKLVIPFLPPKSQRMVAIYVKFAEFQHTLTYFRSMKSKDFDDLKSCLPKSTMDFFDNIMNIMNMMSMFQEMQGDFDFMSMMGDVLTPEQQEIFHNAMTGQQKEGDVNDGLDK